MSGSQGFTRGYWITCGDGRAYCVRAGPLCKSALSQALNCMLYTHYFQF